MCMDSCVCSCISSDYLADMGLLRASATVVKQKAGILNPDLTSFVGCMESQEVGRALRNCTVKWKSMKWKKIPSQAA